MYALGGYITPHFHYKNFNCNTAFIDIFIYYFKHFYGKYPNELQQEDFRLLQLLINLNQNDVLKCNEKHTN